MVGLELVEDVKNYVFVAGIDADKSNLKNQTAEANLIFMDGTRETAKVDMDKSTSAPVKLADNSAYDTTKGLLDGRTESRGDFALLNTWCTYTVNANGVYTLTEVAKAIDDGTGTTAKTKIKTAQYHDDVNGAKINTKNTALAGALSGSYAKVYGNDNSVYLTAKLDYVRYDGTNYAAVISSADNVVTNIDKADITTENSTTVAAKDKFNNLGITSATAAGGVYTLYNDKGYVIAAMVVGKDAGATSNLVYVHTDDVERERYNPKTSRATTDGDWTWVRKVIFEGEEVELTETGDNLQYINASSMVEGSWYKVTFNANNEVISSASVFGGKADMVVGPGVNSADPAAKAEAIYRAVDINPSINEYDTVVFQRVYVGDSNDVAQYVVRPSLVGNTLYVETKNDTGVRVAEDVKTVLVQTKANKEETTYYTTSTQLKNIIDDLNDNGDGYKFQMNLVILKGAVRYVVIRDDIRDGYKPTEPTGSVKVSFFDTQYPVTGDNRYDFYVNGKLVTSFDETVPGEKSFKVAANDAIRVLVRGQANKFGADGDVTVDTADKVAGVVSAKSTILSFKATESLVRAPAGDIGAAGSDDDDNVAANVKGNLIVMKGTENVTGTAKVTKVEINAGDDGKVDNETDNKLKFTFTLPAGYEPALEALGSGYGTGSLRPEAAAAFRGRYEDDELFQGLPDENFPHRFAIDLKDIGRMSQTKADLEALPEIGPGNVNAYEDEAAGFITIRNVAGIVCVVLIAVLFLVSVFIIANTIKLTTFDRRDEIAIMKMVGATNGFIRWPFVYEGFLLGLFSAVIGFFLQWGLYEAVARSVATNDTINLISVVPFETMWEYVAVIFAGAGMLIGVGGSLSAIRKFLQV